MTTIHLQTLIKAPITTIFDLSRNISIHEASAAHSGEKAIAGVTSGLINLGETVTWRAKHFGFYLTHTSIISEMKKPTYFVDEMTSGAFESVRHEHIFEETSEGTKMIDVFEYEVPYGIFGRIFDALVLKSYLKNFLLKRNQFLKKKAEET